jgi:hypothetical protein
LKSAIPGSLFARKYESAKREMLDVISRLRTGASLTENEEKFYKSQLPSLKDLSDPGTINYKINLFRDLFNGLAGNSASPVSGQDPLGIF